MKILCAYSSIEFTVDHFPASLFSREAYHPIFDLPQKRLIGYIGKWSAGDLTPIDSYLLFLAVLRSTDLVQFRVPAIRTDRTPTIIAQHMEPLMKIVIRMNTVMNPSVHFPHTALTPETKSLDNVHHWIYNWQQAYQDFIDGKVRDYDDRKLQRREAALERLIKSPHREISSYASQIADWASDAAEFPTFKTINRFTGQEVICSEYWKHIILRAASDDYVYGINREDLEELIEHCETNLYQGTVFYHALLKLLRSAREKQKNFLSLGDIDIKGTTFKILTQTDTVESANMQAAILSAPLNPPKLEDYPTKFAYMRAKLNYDMQKKYGGT